jgi:hypothetical protein
MIFKVRIFLNPPSGCSCGNSQQDSTLIRCFAFVNNLKSPIVLVNDVIKSIGRYPDKEEVRKWKRGKKDS